MARAHHRTAANNGPDAIDWFEAAQDAEQEFLCEIRLVCRGNGAQEGMLQVRAIRYVGGQALLLAVEALPFPNTKFQSFWPSAFLLLHRVVKTLAAAAYAE